MSISVATGDNPYRMVLRRAVVPSAAAGVLTAIVLWVAKDLTAFLSALVGAVIALGFFASGMAMMAKFVKKADPMLFMAVGMATYFGQVIVLLGVLILARRVDALDSWSAGIAMLVCVVVWQIAQVLAWRTARVLVYDEPAADEQSPA